MYLVPLEIPKYCNHCPFGMCNYSYPSKVDGWKGDISKVDGMRNLPGTYGYTCNLDFKENGEYTRVIRNNFDENLDRPNWCKLREV